MKKIFQLIIVSLVFSCVAQAQYGPNYNIVGMLGGTTLRYPWAGGLNSPQFSAADLDHDGINDLVVFDRAGSKLLTFRNNGGTYPNNYDYAPQFEVNFPSMNSWCLLMDFNCDNVPDIFTHTTLGIQVYRGYYDFNNMLAFSLYKSLLYYEASSGPLNLLVTSVDIPGIADINNDGDLDILTFDSGGSQEQYFENLSQESGWGCDSLYFDLKDRCWGHFYEGTIRTKYLDTCLYGEMQMPHDNPNSETRGGPLRHTGSTTLIFDNTGDGLKEAFVGDINYNNISYLTNNGTVDNAHIFAQDTTFPSYNVQCNAPYFPAAFRLDANNDGKLDLIMAPNAEDAGINSSACAWLYQNTGTNNAGTFDYVIDSFLVKDMFDVGMGCSPVWFDYDNDGLTDLLLANYKYFDTSSYIAALKNVGTVTAPAFKLTKRNYISLASLNKTNLHPTFGDLDNDGDLDMVLGNEDGTLLYYQNDAAVGNPAQFSLTQTNYFNIDVVTGNSAPQLFDVNGDGLLDLIIGKSNGKLDYYQNQGTSTNPDFSVLTNSVFGGVGVGSTALDASSTPCMTHLPGYSGSVLLVGNKNGQVQLYDNIDGNLSGTFNLVTDNYSGIRGGKRTSIDAKDINGDGVVELAIGQWRGGVTIYDTASHSVSVFETLYNQSTLNVYPNPVNNQLYFYSANSFHQPDSYLLTYDVMGRQIKFDVRYIDANTASVDVSQLPAGIYFTRLITNNSQSSCSWVRTE